MKNLAFVKVGATLYLADAVSDSTKVVQAIEVRKTDSFKESVVRYLQTEHVGNLGDIEVANNAFSKTPLDPEEVAMLRMAEAMMEHAKVVAAKKLVNREFAELMGKD